VIVDIHGHARSVRYVEQLEAGGWSRGGLSGGLSLDLTGDRLDERIALLDRCGIDVQLISAGPALPALPRADDAVAAARLLNDEYAELVRRAQGRLAAFATVPFPGVEEAREEMCRAFDVLGLIGVSLTPTLADVPLHDASLAPLFEELDLRGGVVLLHPAGGGRDWPALAASGSALIGMIGMPIEDSVAAMQLVLAGIPARYPRIAFINPHLGGLLPMVMQRLDNIADLFRVDLPEAPSVGLRRMWFDAVCHAHEPALRCGLESYGADRVVFGTDFPAEDEDTIRASIDQIRAVLPPADVDAVLGGTASELLGLVR
jgi:6-methylsalicylate decarboxylase